MDRKRIVLVGAIVGVAGTAGLYVQGKGSPAPRAQASVSPTVSAPAPAAPTGMVETAAVAADMPAPLQQVPPLPAVAGVFDLATATPAPNLQLTTETPIAAPLIVETAGAVAKTADAVPAGPLATACPEDLALLPQPGAMLEIGLVAPCRAGQRVVIRHSGLAVTGRISEGGALVASIPALEAQAEVTVAFADSTRVSAMSEVGDLQLYDRFAVQWMDGDAFGLHAFEAGAELGAAEHVWADAPRAAGATGGFLTEIGSTEVERPLRAQVYTWPAGVAALSGDVSIMLEAAVTPDTCGRELIGETVQLTTGRLAVRDLTLAMPGCEAVGEFVMMHDILETERHAAN